MDLGIERQQGQLLPFGKKDMKPVTAGERLYLLIRNEVLDLTCEGPITWANVGSLFEGLSGGSNYAAYVRGAAAIHATRRLLRHCEGIRENTPDESQHIRKVALFVRREVFPLIADELSRKLARAVVAAGQASHRPINRSCRASLIRSSKRHTCYLCGSELDPTVSEESPAHLTLEHLWPTSMGGDSIEANLLPACKSCQHDTQDALSWEWTNVHNLVLPASPSSDALNSVSRRFRYAKHYFDALRSIETENLSLKQALIRIGPMKSSITHVSTGLPITFFDLETT